MDSIPLTEVYAKLKLEKIEPAGLQFPFDIPTYGCIENAAAWELFCEYLRYLSGSYQALKRESSMRDDISWIQEHEQDEAYERNE